MDYRDILVKYGVFLGKRFTRKQKVRFLATLTQEFETLGYKTQAVADKEGRNQIVNLYVGDILKADVIVQVNYDTPLSKIGIKLPYQPFDLKARSKENLFSQIVPMILLAIIGMPLVYYAGNNVFNDKIFNFMDVLFVAIFALYFYVSYRISKGIGNLHNMNRYSASILAAIHLADDLRPNQRKKVAFAFTDMGSINLEGTFLMRTHLKEEMDKKLVLILDCLGQGDTLKLQGYNVSENLLEKIKESYQGKYQILFEHALANSKQLATVYPKAIALAVGENVSDKFIVKDVGTKNDIEVDLEELKILVKALNQAYLS